MEGPPRRTKQEAPGAIAQEASAVTCMGCAGRGYLIMQRTPAASSFFFVPEHSANTTRRRYQQLHTSKSRPASQNVNELLFSRMIASTCMVPAESRRKDMITRSSRTMGNGGGCFTSNNSTVMYDSTRLDRCCCGIFCKSDG